MTICPKCNSLPTITRCYGCGSKFLATNGVETGEFRQTDKCRINELVGMVSELLTIISEFDSNPERSLKEKLILLVDELNALRRATNSKGNLISELEAENAKLHSKLLHQVQDECEADAKIRALAATIIGEVNANGDGYPPGLVDVVEMVVERMQAENAKLKSDNTNLRNDLRLLREGLVEALKRASEAEAENAKLVARIEELERRLAVWEDQTLRF